MAKRAPREAARWSSPDQGSDFGFEPDAGPADGASLAVGEPSLDNFPIRMDRPKLARDDESRLLEEARRNTRASE